MNMNTSALMVEVAGLVLHFGGGGVQKNNSRDRRSEAFCASKIQTCCI